MESVRIFYALEDKCEIQELCERLISRSFTCFSDDKTVFIVDKNYKKVDFINPRVESSESKSTIVLDNKGSFTPEENYWIIIEGSVRSTEGKKLKSSLKAQFEITK